MQEVALWRRVLLRTIYNRCTTQEVSHLVWNMKFQYRVHNSLPLNQMRQVQAAFCLRPILESPYHLLPRLQNSLLQASNSRQCLLRAAQKRGNWSGWLHMGGETHNLLNLKAVPLHATKALGWRGVIVHTHS
jgi:hypothetical protein